MFASALGGVLAIGLVMLILVSVFVGAAMSFDRETVYVVKPKTVFKLSLSGVLQETARDNPFSFLSFGESVQTLSLKDIVKSIREARDNDNIEGIYIEAGSFHSGVANAAAIRRELLEFKTTGKFLIAYGDTYTQNSYYICSAADRIFLNPMGSIDIHGLVGGVTFYKGLLNKMGIEMEVFKVGAYKGAVEMFMLDRLSEENREQIVSYQRSIWDEVTDGIAGGRSLKAEDVNGFADSGYVLSPAARVVEAGFADSLAYKAEVEEYVKGLAGQDGDRLKTAGVDKLKNSGKHKALNAGSVAVLYAEGEIVSEVVSSAYGEKVITGKLGDEIDKLGRDEDVKAIVLRVNSPGGSAYVSEQIWREVHKAGKAKPVVVSMSDVAASGGYYISCAADWIVAEATTITGSIGVFSVIPNAAGLFDKLDLTTEVVKTNTYGDLLDISRPFREDEKRLMQSYVEYMYDVFTTRCADGRGKTKAAIDSIAQGRVWTGSQAVEIGLVDAIGGLDEAIGKASELAGLDTYNIRHVTDSKDLLHELLSRQLEGVRASVIKSAAGEEYKYLKALNDIKRSSSLQARLLYDIQTL
jgi:protease-4